MEFPSSPQWKSTEDEKRGWGESQKWFEGTDKRGWGESQKWFEGTDFTGQPGMNPPNQAGDNMFQLDDVDGMFGPGAYEPQYATSCPVQPFFSFTCEGRKALDIKNVMVLLVTLIYKKCGACQTTPVVKWESVRRIGRTGNEFPPLRRRGTEAMNVYFGVLCASYAMP
jgi:hypothetical protein